MSGQDYLPPIEPGEKPVTNLADAIALQAVYQARATRNTTPAQFAEMLKWAYRVQSTKRALKPFIREFLAGCYAAQLGAAA